MPGVARAAATCVAGRAVLHDGRWRADGDPMEAALHCLSSRAGASASAGTDPRRRPYSADRMLSSALTDQEVAVLGAPEAVFRRCIAVPIEMASELVRLTEDGRRVLAVARREWHGEPGEEMEHGLELLGLIGLEDPPRRDVGARS